MKTAVKKYGALLLALVLCIGVFFYFAAEKSGFFLDELYTYGLSNSHYKPFLIHKTQGETADIVFTAEDFNNYLTIADGDSFDFASVYYNQVHDVHPPLYYWLFNIWSSITGATQLSKWTGISLDVLIYTATLILLYLCTKRLTDSNTVSAAAVAMYGLSSMGLTTGLMIRMYVLLTMLTMLLVYLVLKLLDNPSWKLSVFAGLTIFLGLMTQYFYVFFAFFLCAAVVIYALIKKNRKLLLRFSVCAAAGALMILLAFPACIDHLFSDKLVSGGTAVENIKNTSTIIPAVKYYIAFFVSEMKVTVWAAFLCVAACVLFFRKTLTVFSEKRENLRILVFAIPAAITLPVVAVASPVWAERYVYNIGPVLAMIAAWLISLLLKATGETAYGKLLGKVALPVVCLAALAFSFTIEPMYIYREYRDYNKMLSSYSDDPCIYFELGYAAPVTQDVEQLMIFDDVFIADSTDSEKLADYIDGNDEIVIFVDVDEYWSSNLNPEDIVSAFADMGYGDADFLYANGLSETWVLAK